MDMKDQKLATEIAEERMTLIAPLLSQNLDKDSVRLIRAEICERNQISQRTLERYLTSYLKGGFDALKPQSRSAECKYKIPQELLDEAIRLRRELPSRSVPTIIKILELEGKAEPGFLKRTTLQDALSRAGYSSAIVVKTIHNVRRSVNAFFPNACFCIAKLLLSPFGLICTQD